MQDDQKNVYNSTGQAANPQQIISSTVSQPQASASTVPQNPSVPETSPVQTSAGPSVPQQPIHPVVPQQTQQMNVPQQPSAPIAAHQEPIQTPSGSFGHPEYEPLPAIGNTEWESLTEPEVQLPEEVKEAGVVSVPQQAISSVSQQIPVETSAEAVVLPGEATLPIHLPMAIARVHQVMKTDNDMRDSLRWLATLIFREIEIAERKKREMANKSTIQ